MSKDGTLFAISFIMVTKFLIPPLFILGLSEHLMKAPSVQKIDQIKQNLLEEKKNIHLCTQQLKKNKIPVSCYQINNLSEDLKQYLDKKCLKAPLEAIGLHEIVDLLKNQRISPKCLNILKRRAKILKYQQQDSIIEKFSKPQHNSI